MQLPIVVSLVVVISIPFTEEPALRTISPVVCWGSQKVVLGCDTDSKTSTLKRGWSKSLGLFRTVVPKTLPDPRKRLAVNDVEKRGGKKVYTQK